MTGPLDIRVGDAERDRVAIQLREHLVAGRLTLDEFAARVDAVHVARTARDLDVITTDLPTPAAAAAPVRARRAPRRIVSIMGSVERNRRWRVGPRTTVVTLMGSAALDLRRAEIEGAEATLTVFAAMGSVGVIVPEGVPVDVTGFVLLGDKDADVADVPPLPGAPAIHVRVRGLLGSVRVHSRPRPQPESPPAPG